MTDCIDHGRKGSKLGYSKKRVVINGEKMNQGVHRIAFFNAHGFWPEVVMHSCDNPRCINIDHLSAGNNLLNVKDRSSKGRTARQKGLSNGSARYSDELVKKIYDEYASGLLNQYQLSDKYGVSQQHISTIVNGKYRSEITGAQSRAKSGEVGHE